MASPEEGPDFDSAWNPALRPNSLQDVIPETTEHKKLEPTHAASPQHVEDAMDVEDDTMLVGKVNGHAAFHEDVDPDDDFFQRYGTQDSAGEPPSPQVEPTEPKNSSVSDHETPADRTEPLHLSQSSSPSRDPAQEVDTVSPDIVSPPEETLRLTPLENDAEPAENYEHQSRLALADEAVDESATAPLLADTDAPVPSNGDAPVTNPPMLEDQNGAVPSPDVFTPAGTSALQELEQSGAPDIDWGTLDDFGIESGHQSSDLAAPWNEGQGDFPKVIASQEFRDEVFKSDTRPLTGTEVILEGQNGDAKVPNQGEDLDAMWKAALGDDDFLGGSEDVNDDSFFGDDAEGFLDDTEIDEMSSSKQIIQSEDFVQKPDTNSQRYAPTSLSQSTTLQDQNRGSAGAQTQPINAAAAMASLHQSRPSPTSSQSFAGMSKGGYSSPYDLPMDISRPKKRASAQPLAPGPVHRPMAPPRSSSIPAISPTGLLPNAPPQSVANLSPPPSSHSSENLLSKYPSAGTSVQQPSLATKPSTGDFFADLPVASRSRGTGQSGRYTPNPSAVTPPPTDQRSTTHTFSPPKSLHQNAPYNARFEPQLQSPPKLNPFSDTGSVTDHPGQVQAPPTSNKYSPATQANLASGTTHASPLPGAPTAGQNRYASVPKAPPPSSYAKSYAPRTSSPLASHQTSPLSATNRTRSSSNPPRSLPDTATEPPPRQHATNMSVGNEEFSQGARASSVHEFSSVATPATGLGLSSHAFASKVQNNYMPQSRSQPNLETADLSGPNGSHQSPTLATKGPRIDPISVHKAAFAHSPGSPDESQHQVINANLGRRRGMSQDLGFVAPPNETSQDPLERWKGYPIFHWGMAGHVVTSFPKQIPRYGPGHGIPTMKSGPGEICVQNSKTLLPLPEEIAKFPGPLKSKSKKKDVIAWLNQKLNVLQQESSSSIFGMTKGSDAQTRLEEKVLLWNVMRILIEHDGVLEGNPNVEEAVRRLLNPQSGASMDMSTPLSAGADITGIAPSSSAKLVSEAVDPSAVEILRQHLLKGEREKAVWHAVDKRLWAHALLISSTLGPDSWKQVIREFVRHEVRNIGSNTNSLAALYEVFAGNWEESTDELVPAATRAGFQMVSKLDGSGSARNAYEGLDRWRESLCLILSNRTPEDGQAIMSLGKLLADYGRMEAAHTCFLFARNLARIGGPDDLLSNICLFGADHVHRGHDFGRDMDAILLTELYEFALSLATPSAVIPHLQPFKFWHAALLAENGQRSEAQQYCDAILTAMKSTTRPSPYYHGGLISQLDDLSKRLSQAPKDASSSWIMKPSMDKMSGTMWNKFQNFVSGDDSDNGSTRSGGGAEIELGPFAKIAGDSPVISRSTSSTDLYGAYGSAPALPTVTSMNSRYAPASHHGANSKTLPEHGIHQRQSLAAPQTGRPSLESSRSFDPLMPTSHTTSPEMMRPYGGTNEPRPRSTPYVPHTEYSPQQMPPIDGHIPSPSAPSVPAMQYNAWGNSQPALASSPDISNEAQFSRYTSSLGGPLQSSYQPSMGNTYEASSGSYEPPSNSYAPPSYSSYEPFRIDQNEDTEINQADQPLSKKKSFMDADDNDDELMRRAASLKQPPSSQSSREPDDAVRKAAEADAARDAEAKAGKKGWFTGWFKKDPNAAPGPIKAKLGDESSFVYDPELKRWVNKKGGEPVPAPTATPPPPKGPSRSASAAGPPPPPSRTVSSSSLGPPMGSRPPSSVPLPGSAAPSRAASPSLGLPASGLQNEILAGEEPSAAPGPTSHPAPFAGTPAPPNSTPPSRPATGMSNASSIDDLIGVPQARKGGTVRGKKKGGRYVDVMAK